MTSTAQTGDHSMHHPLEYLVTMTTHVPDGTPDQAVEDIAPARPPTRASSRRRDTCCACGALRCNQANGARSGCSPPPTATELEEVLASMPLRVWRTDEVTPLSPHPNDPATPTPGARETRYGVPDRLHPGRPAGHRRPRRCEDTKAREAQARP